MPPILLLAPPSFWMMQRLWRQKIMLLNGLDFCYYQLCFFFLFQIYDHVAYEYPSAPSYCREQGRLFDVGTLHASSNWHPFFVDLSHEKRLTLCSYQIISVNPSQFFVDAPTNLGLLWLFCLFFYSFIPISTWVVMWAIITFCPGSIFFTCRALFSVSMYVFRFFQIKFGVLW